MISIQRYVLATFAFIVTGALPALGLSAEGTIGKLQYSVYAPDWTWQGRDANIMAVIDNQTDAPAACSISLTIREEHADHFGRNGAPGTSPLTQQVSVPPGQTRRIALTGLTALHGFPRQTYPLTLSIRVNDRESNIDYPLQTIRGQAVSEGLAVSLGVPIGVALLFSAAFALVLRKTGDPDAWKVVPAPKTESRTPESWINETPK